MSEDQKTNLIGMSEAELVAVAGLMGAVGSFGGMLFNLLIGQMLAGNSNYAPVFVIAGLLHPLSFLLVLGVIRRINPVLERP